jgi:hypothetical protein
VSTARALYENVENSEIERTSNYADLSYIPDDLSFEGREIKYVFQKIALIMA